MKIFLVGEGPTDCGKAEYRQREGEYRWVEGPVQIYMRKYLPDAEIETMDRNSFLNESRNRKDKRNRRTLAGLKGHGTKAFFVSEMAKERGCDTAAVYVDSDKDQRSSQKTNHECKSRYDEICGQLKTGFEKSGISRYLAIVPVKMIECWLMGDPVAFSSVYEKKPDPNLLRNPELLWGDEHNPDSSYPKNQLKRVLEQCGAECSMEEYNRIATAANRDTVAISCPISFADFTRQLTALT